MDINQIVNTGGAFIAGAFLVWLARIAKRDLTKKIKKLKTFHPQLQILILTMVQHVLTHKEKKFSTTLMNLILLTIMEILE